MSENDEKSARGSGRLRLTSGSSGMGRKSGWKRLPRAGEGRAAALDRTGLGKFLSKSTTLFIAWRRLRKTDSSSRHDPKAHRHF